jgi:hypothetical protein
MTRVLSAPRRRWGVPSLDATGQLDIEVPSS